MRYKIVNNSSPKTRMATSKTSLARIREHHIYNEVVALVLLGIGTLLFLSLVSYSPNDVPSWFPLGSVRRAARVSSNFIGPFGAIIACLSYSLLGAASYLFTAILLGCGGVKLMSPTVRLSMRVIWAGVFVVAGACLLHLLPWSVLDARRLGLPGEGGWLGKWIAGDFLHAVVGQIGALIICSLLYVISLVLLTGLQPVSLLRRGLALAGSVPERVAAWREERAAAKTRDEALKLKVLAPPTIKEAKEKTKKNIVRVGSPEAEAETLVIPAPVEVPPQPVEPPRPEPVIFDASVPPLPRIKREKPEESPTLAAVDCENYVMPSFDLLDPLDLASRQAADPEELKALQVVIIETLMQFGIVVSAGDITRGPTITRYEVYPAKGVRVDRITALERDIARATRAERINILAPIPGKDTVGIEIANLKKQKVAFRELLESEEFHSTKCKIPIALGKDVYGKAIIADLAAMPHGLVAGTTGSGKSVCINAIIASILYRFKPSDLRFIMIDPKVVEMQMYNTLPHLVVPVVTDPKKVLLALKWAVDEMEKRYSIFAKTGVRNIGGFNARPRKKTQKELDAEKGQAALFDDSLLDPAVPPAEAAPVDPETLTSEERVTNMGKQRNSREMDLIVPDQMPYIVIIVDELADLMQTAPADVESAIARITQKARAAGIHMIIATQTPRADVITGVIKANVPCRIAFQVASALDSRVILDENGAERLLGMGDMLYRPPGTSRMVRAQGVLVTDDEIRRVVDHASAQGEPQFESAIHQKLEGDGEEEEEEVSAEDEELVEKCYEVMRQEKKASTSLFQRRLRLGYTRAARILDIMEMRGYVGPGEGAKPREILVDLESEEI
jgi:S-DNA-T family DNA segregation ATPase FtsK/SpoIIIE